jgi:hypothetical protein
MADTGCIRMLGFEGWQMGNSIETAWSDLHIKPQRRSRSVGTIHPSDLILNIYFCAQVYFCLKARRKSGLNPIEARTPFFSEGATRVKAESH